MTEDSSECVSSPLPSPLSARMRTLTDLQPADENELGNSAQTITLADLFTNEIPCLVTLLTL